MFYRFFLAHLSSYFHRVAVYLPLLSFLFLTPDTLLSANEISLKEPYAFLNEEIEKIEDAEISGTKLMSEREVKAWKEKQGCLLISYSLKRGAYLFDMIDNLYQPLQRLRMMPWLFAQTWANWTLYFLSFGYIDYTYVNSQVICIENKLSLSLWQTVFLTERLRYGRLWFQKISWILQIVVVF